MNRTRFFLVLITLFQVECMEMVNTFNIFDAMLPMNAVQVESCFSHLKISNLKTFNSKLKNIICFFVSILNWWLYLPPTTMAHSLCPTITTVVMMLMGKNSYEIWKEIKVNENQIWFLLMPLIFPKCFCVSVCVCISGLILSSFCFSVRLLRFQCHIESKSKLRNERGICIWCHSDGFDSIFFPCAIAALYAVLHLGHHVFHKHKHIDDIHATHIYWNVYV